MAGLHGPSLSMNTRLFVWHFLLLLALTSKAWCATYAPEQLRHDLKQLYETLQDSHYDLFAYVPKAMFDRAYQQANDTMERPMDDLEAMEFLLDKIKATKNNGEFFDSMRR